MLENKKNNAKKLYGIINLYIPFVLYLIINLIYFFNWHKFFAGNIFAPSGDPLLFIWSFNWWPWSILHGINPFITHYLWSPTGYNLTWAGSMPMLAIIASPITLIFGAATAYNILAMIALPLSAYFAFLLLRYITKDSFASFVGGYLFGFSTFELAEYLGHIFLYFSFIIPLLILLVIKKFHKDINRFLFIILFALLIAFEVGISEEIAFTATFFGFISFLIFYIFANKDIRRQIFKLSLDIGIAYFGAVILLSPFLYYLIIGFGRMLLPIHSFISSKLTGIANQSIVKVGVIKL